MEQIELKDNVIVEDISESLNDLDNIESTGMDTKTILGLLPVLILLLIMFIRLIFVIYKSNGKLIFFCLNTPEHRIVFLVFFYLLLFNLPRRT